MSDLPKSRNASHDQVVADQISALCADYDAAWQASWDAGVSPPIEVYLAQIEPSCREILRSALERIRDKHRNRPTLSESAARDTSLAVHDTLKTEAPPGT